MAWVLGRLAAGLRRNWSPAAVEPVLGFHSFNDIEAAKHCPLLGYMCMTLSAFLGTDRPLLQLLSLHCLLLPLSKQLVLTLHSTEWLDPGAALAPMVSALSRILKSAWGPENTK